jgi:hypothetical protein
MSRNGALLLVGALLTGAPVAAQTIVTPAPVTPAPGTPVPVPSAPGGVIAVPQQVQACLCLEQRVNDLGTDIATRRQTYEQRRQEVSRLDSELASLRQRMNVDNPDDVAAYARLFDQRNAAFDALSRDVEPQYAASVERYNRAVADYNNSCYTQSYDATVLATVRPTLSCPPP